MKKTLLVVTIATGAVLAAAFAQPLNVTLCGITGADVSYQDHVDGGANDNDSVIAPTSGGLSRPRWGIRGAEDLGNNLKGISALENGFNINTGKSAQGSRLFGHQVHVGLQDGFGAVTLGRQQNALYDLPVVYDPMAVGPNHSLDSVDSQFNGRADDAVKYTGKFGGLITTGFYSSGRDSNSGLGGGAPGSFKVGKNYDVDVAYTNDSLSVGVAYDQYQDSIITTSALDTKRVAIGVSYVVGDVKVFAGYCWLCDEVTTDNARHDNLCWLGALYKLTSVFTLTDAAYYTNAYTDSSSSWIFVLNADYALSERTDTYTLIDYMNNKGNTAYDITDTANMLPGQNQTGATVGVRHHF